MKEFFKYIFRFEKARYYSGGALRGSVRITQKFWDEMKERKEFFDNNKDRGFPISDTTYGSQTADLGERPKVPDRIVELRENIFWCQGVLGWCLIVALILSRLLK